MKQKSIVTQWLAGMAIVLLCVLGVELLYANRQFILGGAPAPVPLALRTAQHDSALLRNQSGTDSLLLQTPGDTTGTGQTATITFSVPEEKQVREIAVVCRAVDDDGALGFVRVDTKDDATKYVWQWADTASFVNRGTQEVRVRVSTYGALHEIQLGFTTSKAASVEIVSVTLHPAPVFVFHATRAVFWLCVLGGAFTLWLLIRKKALLTLVYDGNNKRHRAAVLSATALCVLLAVLLAVCVARPNLTLEEIAGKGMVNSSTAYARQFSALLHGQLHLELPADPDLEALDNVYDASERIHEGVDYYSDYAYVDGKYYSYFGIAPLLFVHAPIYLATRTIASDALVCSIFAVLLLLLLCGALEQILRAFSIRTTLLLRVAAVFALCFGSTVYMMQQWPSMYNNAILCAGACLAGFLYFAFRAYNTAGGWQRPLCLFAAGVAAFGIVGSRPIVALLALCWGLPLFVQMLLDRTCSVRKRALDAASFLVPAVVGCTLLLGYNYARFGALFDFGVMLQLTIYDAHAYGVVLNPVALWQALSSYFFGTNLRYLAGYPFVRFDYLMQPLLGRFAYQNIPSLSAFSMPLVWGWLTLPNAWRSGAEKTRTVQKWTGRLVTIGILVCACLEFFLGGADIRYLFDFLPALCLLATIALLQCAFVQQQKGSNAVSWAALGLCLLTVCTGSTLLFYATNATPMLYQTLREMVALPW